MPLATMLVESALKRRALPKHAGLGWERDDDVALDPEFESDEDADACAPTWWWRCEDDDGDGAVASGAAAVAEAEERARELLDSHKRALDGLDRHAVQDARGRANPDECRETARDGRGGAAHGAAAA